MSSKFLALESNHSTFDSNYFALPSKLLALIAAILIPLCICTQPCESKFMRVEVTKVPITRLLTNLEGKAKSSPGGNKDRGMVEFQIGRLHSMAYAMKTEEAIWQDLDCDGLAEADEVKSLEDHGIEALSCQARPGSNGFLHNPEGVKFSSGENGETVDWIVE